MTSRQVRHRTETGRAYRGIPIHAAPGLHEFLGDLISAICPKGAEVLELGAGSGAMTARLIDLGYGVTPLDLDDAAWSCESVRPILVDLNAYDWVRQLHGREFAVVTAVEVIEHLENPKHFIRSLFTVTSPGGICLITTPNVLCADSVNQLIRKESFFCFNEEQYFATGHISILPWWLLRLMAVEAGFTVDAIQMAGLMDKHGIRLLGLRALEAVLRAVRPARPVSVTGDGLISVVVLRKP